MMEAFQQTMRAFLETQRATMLAYLGHRGTEPVADSLALRPGQPPTLPRWKEGGQDQPATVPDSGTASSAIPIVSSNGSALAEPVRNQGARGTRSADAGGGLADARGSHQSGPVPRAKVERLPCEDIPSASIAGPGRDAIAERLVGIVRDRTGYPAEMLKLDLDLEADLGIDSIKRVEILGTLRESVAGLESATDSTLMDALARARTLGEIVDRVATTLEARRPASPEEAELSPAPESPEAPDVSASALRRMTLGAVDAPLADGRHGLMPGSIVVVTDDGRGVAGALGEALRSEGHAVEVVGRDRLDFSSPAAVEAFLDEVRASGPIAGIVHALPLGTAEAPGLDPAAWSDRMGAEVKGLFLLARAAAPDLEHASRRGGACLVAATAMGGTFAAAGAVPDAFFPGQGGIAGLVKTLAREWPDVRARVVDLDPSEPPETLAARLAAEALADDGWPEVGYSRGRRIRLRAIPTPLDRSAPAFSLAPGEPVLITGGARGITAAVAEELARRWRPTLLLVGSSPLPPDSEDPATSGLSSASELKAALHGRLRRAGGAVGPADLERAYRTLLNERRIRVTLRALRDAGSSVHYARADVRDAEALARALESWRGRFGDPVGLIHGAGVIHDKLLRDKTPDSFDRVLGTKLDGALNLARLLRPEPLRFAALFSSIAGRFGNKGQSDYAAANEALNKLAIWLDRRLPGRVVSVNWGPWSGVGMVSDLEGHLGRRGLGMIPPEVGRTAMADELSHGPKGDVEVVLAGELGSLDEPLRAPARPAEGTR